MINALFAVDQYGGMGNNGTLPWPHCPADLKNFKDLTDGHVVVMGRRSWDDPKLPKPLPGRTVYVATSRSITHATPIEGDIRSHVLTLEKNNPNKIIWVVGGPTLLESCSDIYNRIYLTHFRGSFKVDTKINLKSFLASWSPVRATAVPDINCTFVVYENLFRRTE